MTDDVTHDDPNALLARRLKEARSARGLSLQAASELTGVSRSMLSQIERGDSSPTLTTVWSLARAFGLDIGHLVGADAAEGGIAVRPRADQPVLDDIKRGVRMRILSAPQAAGHLECYDIALDAGAALRSGAHWPGCREQITVLQGSVKVTSGSHQATLSQGDVGAYAADQPHEIAAEDGPAQVYLIVHKDTVLPS